MKSLKTKDHILKIAFESSRVNGLMGMSIGNLAKKVGMSKSGLFGHFKSKERLQIMTLDYSAKSFTESVIIPSIKSPRGIERIRKMVELWLNWSAGNKKGGCPFVSAIVEFDDHPGAVRDHLKKLQTDMLVVFERSAEIAAEEGEFQKENLDQFAFELYSQYIGFHIYTRLLEHKRAKDIFYQSFDELIHKFSKESQ